MNLPRPTSRSAANSDDASTISKPGLFRPACSKAKSNDEDDEGANAVNEKPAPAQRDRRRRSRQNPPTRCRRRARNPRVAATFQLASADAQIVQPGKPKTGRIG